MKHVRAVNDGPVPIKNRIQNYRKGLDISQEEMADALWIQRTYLSKIENHVHSPGPELMKKICEFFNKDLGEIFYIESGGC